MPLVTSLYVCVCVWVHVCGCMCACVHVHVCVCVCIRMCMCVYRRDLEALLERAEAEERGTEPYDHLTHKQARPRHFATRTPKPYPLNPKP